jgi:acetyl esterase/lipase
MLLLNIILIVILMAGIILILFPAPTNFLWKLAVLMGGFAHFIALLCLLFMIFTPFFVSKIIFGLLSILYALPYLEAIYIAINLQTPFSHLYCWFPFLLNKTSISTFEYAPSLSLDLYHSNKKFSQKQSCVLVIHGGSWSSGNKGDLSELNHFLANQGIIVAAVSYRLAPENHFPIPLDDIRKAYEYLYINSDSLHIDRSKIFVLGRSAGGQLAQIFGFEFGRNKIKGIISYYTPSDLVWGYENPAPKLVHDSRCVLRNYLGGDLNSKFELYKAASPVYSNLDDAPPLLMLHGKKDVLVAFGHNTRLIEKLQPQNIPYRLISFSNATHGFDFFFHSPTAQLAAVNVQKFITDVLNRTL